MHSFSSFCQNLKGWQIENSSEIQTLTLIRSLNEIQTWILIDSLNGEPDFDLERLLERLLDLEPDLDLDREARLAGEREPDLEDALEPLADRDLKIT